MFSFVRPLRVVSLPCAGDYLAPLYAFIHFNNVARALMFLWSRRASLAAVKEEQKEKFCHTLAEERSQTVHAPSARLCYNLQSLSQDCVGDAGEHLTRRTHTGQPSTFSWEFPPEVTILPSFSQFMTNDSHLFFPFSLCQHVSGAVWCVYKFYC